jgi:hypothetical protein
MVWLSYYCRPSVKLKQKTHRRLAVQNRAPGLRHGIALDRHVTIILSQNEDARPLCGIYFNLHSPFRKKSG